jgi:hypothetical protein
MKHVRFSVDLTPRFPKSRLIAISRQTKCALRFTGVTLDAVGDVDGVLAALNLIKDAKEIQQYIGDVNTYLEMSSEYKDFITGKKNGKINKIIKTAGVNLTLNEDHAHTLVVQMGSAHCFRVIDALTQLKVRPSLYD